MKALRPEASSSSDLDPTLVTPPNPHPLTRKLFAEGQVQLGKRHVRKNVDVACVVCVCECWGKFIYEEK